MKRAAAALVLAAAACGSAPRPPAEGRRETVENLTLSQTENGQPAWTLNSRLAFVREDADSAVLERPTMEFYREGKIVSKARAETGSVRTDSRDVRLSSGVVLDSLSDHSHLTTETLLYVASSGRFHTDAPVELVRPEGILVGKGLDASPDLSEIRIYEQRSVLRGSSK